jgi:hypothetical protein
MNGSPLSLKNKKFFTVPPNSTTKNCAKISMPRFCFVLETHVFFFILSDVDITLPINVSHDVSNLYVVLIKFIQ